MNRKKFPLQKASQTKFVPINKILPKKIISWQSKSRAGVVMDNKKNPQFFIFNVFAFLDLLSEIDERLVDKLSSKDYYSSDVNPSGAIIDEIE